MSEHRRDAERLAELHYIALLGMAGARGVDMPRWDDIPGEHPMLIDAMEMMLGLGHIKTGDE